MQTVRTNMNVNASTQYSNYDFNSMCVLPGGVIIGGGEGGLFKLCCESTDNGDEIDAYFITPTTNLGTQNKKRCHAATFGYWADGNISISITGDDETTIGPYEVEPKATQGRQVRRRKTGGGMKFRYGSFRVDNVDGADFTIDEIDLDIAVVTRSNE